jgi:uncharacterized protein YdeI (YjbR/CyaY-like superfamily)
MKQIQPTTRSQWRRWLAKHHDREPHGIWLVIKKKGAGRSTLQYEEALEEALCFGWIDSVVKRIDDTHYCRKFTPRKDHSVWSSANKRRAEALIKAGRMTRFGLTKVTAAKHSGRWAQTDPRPVVSAEVPYELPQALARHRKARDSFDGLAPSCRRRFIAWIAAAKRPETRAKRVREALALLRRDETLGLK